MHRARATERVTTGTMDVAERAGKAMGAAASATVSTVHDFDQKMRISERAGNAVGVVKDSAVVQSTAAALGRAGSSVKSATNKVMEQPAVASATEVVGSGIRRLGAGLSSLTSRVVPSSRRSPSPGPEDLDGGGGPAAEVLRQAPSPGVTQSQQQPTSPPPQAGAFTLQP